MCITIRKKNLCKIRGFERRVFVKKYLLFIVVESSDIDTDFNVVGQTIK